MSLFNAYEINTNVHGLSLLAILAPTFPCSIFYQQIGLGQVCVNILHVSMCLMQQMLECTHLNIKYVLLYSYICFASEMIYFASRYELIEICFRWAGDWILNCGHNLRI